jgi:hypothetical protein
MTKFGQSDDLQGAEFVEVNLRGARFVESDLSSAVMRGVDIQGADIDSPWLGKPDGSLKVNGIDVAAYVDAELNRLSPGRAERRAEDPAGLQAAWSAIEGTWATTLKRVEGMPSGTVDVSVDGEWSFAQTQRHLIQATDIWLRRAILELSEPYHPFGLRYGQDDSDSTTSTPTYAEVLEVRADRVAMVRDFIATVMPATLEEPRKNPWSPERPETIRHCLHVILGEEWEHHRFATRDLDTIEST